MSSLIEDVKASFEKKGLEFISLRGSPNDRDRSILTYRDATGLDVYRLVDIRLEDLEEAVLALDNGGPKDIAAFLLRESKPLLA
jgi:hypothetical protein